MKFLLSAFTLLVISTFSCYSQTSGKITGQITLINGQAAEMASVSLIETNKSTLTTDDGNYSFSNLIPGQYTIRIQMLGAAQKDIMVIVTANEVSIANYQLEKENIQALQEVTVAGNTNKFSKKESVYSARLPLKNLENPQVYSIVPKELIIEQMAVDLGSIAKNVPGSGIPMIANQGRVTFRSRGFETEPMVRNGVAGFSFSAIDPANLERIEAIKGPSATLFGTNLSSYGGLYNRVTKKPYNAFGGEVSLYAGSWNFNRVTFDVNTPVNEDKTVLFRLNGASTYEKSFQDIGFTKSISFAPSFSYQINDKLSMLFDLEYGKAKGTSVLRFNPWTKSKKTESIADMNFPYDKLFGSNDLAYETEMMNIFLQFNYKISEQWTSQSILSRSRTSIEGYISALNGTSDTTLKALVMRGFTSFIATDIQQNFIGDFKIGSHRNRLVVGLDYYNNANTFDRVHITGPEVDFTNPSPTSKISKAIIDDLASTGVKRAENNGDNSYAIYASDVFNVTDRLLTMVSLRLDRFESEGVTSLATGINKGKYGQTALSPKLGVVYEVLEDHVSVFSNYMNSFTNKTGTNAAGDVFKPEQANQWEVGLKGDIFNHKLVGTISYYDIQVDNMVRTDPDDVNYMIQNGTQSSKGFEVELTANPFTGFNIVAGYTYNDSKMTKADKSIEGLRPALSGPDKMLNFWMSYKFQQGKLKGFGAGFGGNYGSESFQTNTTTRKVTIPSYTMLDAAVFYDMGRFRIGLKADNLTSEKAWSVRLTPQAPLRFMGNVSFKF